MYRSSVIVNQWTSKEGTSLQTEEDCRMAMVWIALLGGGDYAPEGLPGFGESLVSAPPSVHPYTDYQARPLPTLWPTLV